MNDTFVWTVEYYALTSWYGPLSTILNFFQSFGTFNERQLTKDIQAVPVLLARCEKWSARCTKCTLPKNAKVLQATTHHKETVLRSTPHSTLFSKNRIFDYTIPTLKQFFFPFINIEFIPFFHCCRLDLRALVTSSIRMCITKPAWWYVYRFQICSSFWLNHFKHYDVISVFIVGTWLYIVADIFVKQLIILDWEIGATIGFV